jgi:hypothetical protein
MSFAVACRWILAIVFVTHPALHIDAAVENIFVHTCCLQQMLAVERPLWGAEKSVPEFARLFAEASRIRTLGPEYQRSSAYGEAYEPIA